MSVSTTVCTHEVLPLSAPLATRCPDCDKMRPYGGSVASTVSNFPAVAKDAPILAASYMTANVRTRNSSYVVVGRKEFVVAIREEDGRILRVTGGKVAIEHGHMVLRSRDGVECWTTSEVTSIYIMEN